MQGLWEKVNFEDFSNFIDTNPEIKRIEMSNWGEIFLNKDIVKILEYAFRKGVTLIMQKYHVHLNMVLSFYSEIYFEK